MNRQRLKIPIFCIVIVCLSFCVWPPRAHASKLMRQSTSGVTEGQNAIPEADNQAKKDTPAKKSIFSMFKDKDIDFFPIPVFETRPDEGQSYGAMPVVLFSDKDSKAISVILALLGQYNSIIKFNGAAMAHYFPRPMDNPEEVLELCFEYAQKYAREATVHYVNPRFLRKYFFESNFVWLKTPFPRFYGYGAGTVKNNESNFVARNFIFETTFGYPLVKNLRAGITEKFTTTDVLTRAFPNVADTLTRYGALVGVNDSTNLIHRLSVTFDTRPSGIMSTKGTFAEGGYFLSHKALGSDQTFQGFSLEAIKLIPFFKERTITALRFFLQDMYGTGIPFYLQSSLGGPYELRAFIPNRFTDTSKMILSWEQRIKVLSIKVIGVPCDFYADPFFEAGRVFHHLDHFDFNNLQPVGGIALRGVVPPNVVGRVDMGFGREGYSIYTMLGYAF
ncbi:MAG: BamA/TamA family outer membrane protein [Deltaproteobacteria bacterium]|nr:BamA/TamA family outer membrane protein [Deltaproteobacteria bacterium]